MSDLSTARREQLDETARKVRDLAELLEWANNVCSGRRQVSQCAEGLALAIKSAFAGADAVDKLQGLARALLTWRIY